MLDNFQTYQKPNFVIVLIIYILAMVCYFLKDARYETVLAHIVSVIDLHLLKQEQSVANMYIFKPFLQRIKNF